MGHGTLLRYYTCKKVLEKLIKNKDIVLDVGGYDGFILSKLKDKKRLKNLGYKKILVVPNGVDTKYFKISQDNKPSSLVFIGDLIYKPNLNGLKYFFKRIYPLIPSSIPINIVGKYDGAQFKKEKKLKNVNFYGFVTDVRPYLRNSILICSLLDGGGTRIKILTAFSAGSPVVSTSKGAEGIECTNNKNICIANTPRLFAKKIHNIFSNNEEYKRLRKNARKLVESKYDWVRIIKNYDNFLNKTTK